MAICWFWVGAGRTQKKRRAMGNPSHDTAFAREHAILT